MTYNKFTPSVELHVLGITMFLSAQTAQGKKNLPSLSECEGYFDSIGKLFASDFFELTQKEINTNHQVLKAEYVRAQKGLCEALEKTLDVAESVFKKMVLKAV